MNWISITIVLINWLSLEPYVLAGDIGVPVLLWRNTDSDQRLAFDEDLVSKSTVHQLSANGLSDDYLKTSETIVAFVQNRLSLEQFTGEDEIRLKTIKKIFTDRSALKPTLLTDVLNPTSALSESKRFRREKWDELVVHNGDRVWVQLPDESLAQNDRLLAELLDQITRNVSKNALFLLTGRQNQFDSVDLDEESEVQESQERYARAVQEEAPEAPEAEQKSPVDDKRLVFKDNCLYLYTSAISLSILNTTYNVEIDTIDTNDTVPTVGNLTQCWKVNLNDSSQSAPAVLELTYLSPNDTKLHLVFEIDSTFERNHTKYQSDFWRIRTGVATVSAKNDQAFKDLEFDLDVKHISSEDLFSYSCSHLSIVSALRNGTNNELIQLELRFTRFQLQPFESRHKQIFDDSFDCEVWFTLPIWMGLLVLILLFSILSMGVYYIAIVNTPDRFENPKSKPLMINNLDE